MVGGTICGGRLTVNSPITVNSIEFSTDGTGNYTGDGSNITTADVTYSDNSATTYGGTDSTVTNLQWHGGDYTISVNDSTNIQNILFEPIDNQLITRIEGEGGRVWYNPRSDNRNRKSLKVVEGPEEKARRLLKRMVGTKAFHNYLKNGFITYQAKSDLIYQIAPGHGYTHVWDKGKPVESLCLVFQDRALPPTDAVIMRLLMIENNEEEFRKLAVQSNFSPSRERWTPREAEKGRILKLVEDKAKGNIKIEDGKVVRKYANASGYITFNNSNNVIITAA